MPSRLSHAFTPALALILAAALLGGCRSSGDRNRNDATATPTPTTGAENGSTPTVALEPGDQRHIIVVTAPTGGWSLRWEKRVVRDGTVEEYLTAFRPDPEFAHVQALTPHRMNSNAPLTSPIKVFIRIADHEQDTSDLPFSLAATAPGNN
jgi:hypothetical protein